MSIRANETTYEVYELVSDTYGQDVMGEEPIGHALVSVRPEQVETAENPAYINASHIGITKDSTISHQHLLREVATGRTYKVVKNIKDVMRANLLYLREEPV